MGPNSVSIIIPLKNGLPYFKDVCEALKTQEYDASFEVICVDSGSKDGSIELAESHGFKVVHIASKDFGHGKTRNYGASLSDSELIAFLTHDAIPADPYWLANLVRPMRNDGEVAGVFSRHEAHHEAMCGSPVTDQVMVFGHLIFYSSVFVPCWLEYNYVNPCHSNTNYNEFVRVNARHYFGIRRSIEQGVN